ncbi:uncharacterized protein LOC136080580 [Hydra vulgaris]|uniref:Uncharacterized protein LOC136080580 n=1 Tax=Hydra vulgaris TaxID=6087 RepID=A0ABM4BW59_HYDVU
MKKKIVFFVLMCFSFEFSLTSNILILGGNGMLGSATVHSLLKYPGQYNITIVNRGNWYWDTESTVKPFVKHFECTRGDGFREECAIIANIDSYDVVIDFSAYNPLDIEDILILLQGKFKRYIYISSDSVYEVCKHKDEKEYLIETDAVRPTDPVEREKLAEKDDYGHKKLQGEEVLEKFHKVLKYNFINLRLPDVIGPRDNTLRFWKYFMRVKLQKTLGPLSIPKHEQERQLSLVYNSDVADLIVSLLKPNLPVDVLNQAYNLAFREPISLKKMLFFIGKFVNKGDVFFNETDELIHYGIPSVTRGPIDITKAVNILNWNPSSIYSVLKETCQFYEDAEYNVDYKFSLDLVLDALDVRSERYRDFIEMHFEKLSPKKRRFANEL